VCCTIPIDTGTLSAKPNPTIWGADPVAPRGDDFGVGIVGFNHDI
jgi:hypothetical protein